MANEASVIAVIGIGLAAFFVYAKRVKKGTPAVKTDVPTGGLQAEYNKADHLRRECKGGMLDACVLYGKRYGTFEDPQPSYF